MKEKIKFFLKNETVLVISLILALISCFLVHPDREYLNYIDYRSICILFCLMTTVAGFTESGVFKAGAEFLIGKTKNTCELVFVLVMLCFFSSMLITNDVSLITFVPFALTVLKLSDNEKFIIPAAVFQTVAANLGSMLLPVGNPQNIYLYEKSGETFFEFVKIIFPYSLISFIMIIIGIFIVTKGKGENVRYSACSMTVINKRNAIFYAVLFLICLLTVLRIIPYYFSTLIVLISVLVKSRKMLLKIDYSLLLTFVGFFVFVGNISRIETLKKFLSEIISGKEMIISVISSEIISNVPTALMLSGFTKNYRELIIGTNIGGLGTLIASMASLITFKFIKKDKLKYFAYFTLVNVIFLLPLILFYYL